MDMDVANRELIDELISSHGGGTLMDDVGIDVANFI